MRDLFHIFGIKEDRQAFSKKVEKEVEKEVEIGREKRWRRDEKETGMRLRKALGKLRCMSEVERE